MFVFHALILNNIPGKNIMGVNCPLEHMGKLRPSSLSCYFPLKGNQSSNTCVQKFIESFCYYFIFLETQYYELLTASCVCITEKQKSTLWWFSITYFESYVVKWIYRLHRNQCTLKPTKNSPTYSSHSEMDLFKP